jgi:hypothetical protein
MDYQQPTVSNQNIPVVGIIKEGTSIALFDHFHARPPGTENAMFACFLLAKSPVKWATPHAISQWHTCFLAVEGLFVLRSSCQESAERTLLSFGQLLFLKL